MGFHWRITRYVWQPTFGGVIEILTVTIFVVWGINTGDKIAAKISKKGTEIFKEMRLGIKTYTTIQLPHECLIFDIALKPKVPPSLKTELSEREFTLPADLPTESIIKRVKRRLITDWGIGDIELEFTQNKKVIHLAISAKEAGLSLILPKGKIAIPIECMEGNIRKNVFSICVLVIDLTQFQFIFFINVLFGKILFF